MEAREEGVDFFHLDKSETLIFWARWLNSKGNDTIIRRVKRDEVGCIQNAPLFCKTYMERRNGRRNQQQEAVPGG
jgi:hypothetical protein